MRRQFESCKPRATWGVTAVSERAGIAITGSKSDHRHVKRRLCAMQGPRTTITAWAVIQGIEAAQMIRKGQVLGITRHNLWGQAGVFGAPLGVK